MKNITKLGKAAMDEGEQILKSLLEVCQICHAPMFAAIVDEYNGEHSICNNMVYSGQSHQIVLADDHIRKHILVAAGFEAIPLDKEPKHPDKKINIYELCEDDMENLEKVFHRLSDFSEKHQTSVFAVVATKSKEQSTDYAYFYKIPDAHKLICDTAFGRHINIEEKGFDVVPPREVLSFDIGEVFGTDGE